MPKYIELYKIALEKYIAQAERTHYSLMNKKDKPIYTFGLFSWFRHSRIEYPTLNLLRQQLEVDESEKQSFAVEAIKEHFRKTKWNNHSFNNYLLDEIRKNVNDETWDEHWKAFDMNPIVYYQGLLFRGCGIAPEIAFAEGLGESNTSLSIDDYIASRNGSIGVSTSKSFDVAYCYALPQPHLQNAYEPWWPSSYVYVLDYQQDGGIDLEETFKARGKNIAASLANNKEEINIIKSVSPEDIVSAFYVDREDKIIWHANPGYKRSLNFDALDLSSLPHKFRCLLECEVPSTRLAV